MARKARLINAAYPGDALWLRDKQGKVVQPRVWKGDGRLVVPYPGGPDSALDSSRLAPEQIEYNQRLFDLSVLRLNQLGYFNEIKDTDADIRTNQKDGCRRPSRRCDRSSRAG